MCFIVAVCLISAAAAVAQLDNFYLRPSHKSSGGRRSLINMCQWCQCKFWPPKRIIKFDQHVPNGLQSWEPSNILDLGDSESGFRRFSVSFSILKKHQPVKYDNQFPAIKKKTIPNCCLIFLGSEILRLETYYYIR